jgi:enoyl-CoA hydratase/carnithine racemase
MLLTAQQYNIDEAVRCCLVTRVVADLHDADAYCRRVAECPPLAQRAMKAALCALGEDIAGRGLDRGTMKRIEHLTRLAENSDDGREALRAFREKRPPVFRGT